MYTVSVFGMQGRLTTCAAYKLKTIVPIYSPTSRVDVRCAVGVQNLDVKKAEIAPNFKKEEHLPERKRERLE